MLLGVALCAVFGLLTYAVLTFDVKTIGQSGTDVGFATLNESFFGLTGTHMTLYTVTDWLGLVPIFVCMLFGMTGLLQLVKRRSLFKVDAEILLLGVYYAAVIFLYLAFEMIPINYRPILIDGRCEASYPSSTTLLVVSVMPTLVFMAERKLKNTAVKRLIAVCSWMFSTFMVAGRLISGVHWLTDIIGGVLLGAAMFCLYAASVRLCYERKTKQDVVRRL